MSLKLKTLEEFLRKKGFLREADLCSELSKSAMAWIPDDFGSGEKVDMRFSNKDLKGEHGWVYVLMTEPTNDRSKQGWYVGETATPVLRWLEHSFGTKEDEEGNFFIPDASDIKDLAVTKELFNEEIKKGSRFTNTYPVRRLVALELIDYTPSVSNLDARRKREREVFLSLAEKVGSDNIGSDWRLVQEAKRLDYSPQLIDAEDIVSYIKENILNHETGEHLASALSNIKYEDISPGDQKAINKRVKGFVAKNWRSKEKRYALKSLKTMTESDRKDYEQYISGVINEQAGLYPLRDAIRSLGWSNPAFFATTEELNIDTEQIRKRIQKTSIIKALNTSASVSDAAKTLEVSPTALDNWIKKLDINKEFELNKTEDSKRRSELTSLLNRTQTMDQALEQKPYSPSALKRELERLNINSEEEIGKYHDYNAEEILDSMQSGEGLPEYLPKALNNSEVEILERANIINILNDSKTLSEASLRLGFHAGKIKETKMLKRRSKRYGINIQEELGRNFREEEPKGLPEDAVFYKEPSI